MLNNPIGILLKANEDKVLKHKKVFYGLKQAPRAQNSRIDKYFQENGFQRCIHKYALYVKQEKGDLLFVYIYVDDLIFTGNNSRMFNNFKKVMAQEFEMSDIGLMTYYLGMEVKYMEDGIFIS